MTGGGGGGTREEGEGRREKKEEEGEEEGEMKRWRKRETKRRKGVSLAEDVAQVVQGLPSTHRAPGSIHSPPSAGHGSSCQSSQHSGGRGRRIQVRGYPELQARSCLKGKKKSVGWELNI